jgi:Domain of unknown function (DUF4160)
MPEICRFLGLVIKMYYKDHAPPHFHVTYGEYMMTIDIETGVMRGQFPKRALRLIMEWYELHKDELMQDWALARKEVPLKRIPPLE